MHVGALAVFEGGPLFDERGRFRLADARALVASRLHLIPRFRKRVMAVPLDAERAGLGRRPPLRHRVPRPAHPPLAAGYREQLLDLFERLQIQLLDRDRPLWELWFVEGLEGGHVGLVMKTHHALVDGVSGVDVATVLLDVTPEPTWLEAPPWRPQPAPTPGRLLIDSVRRRVLEPGGPRRTVEEPRGARRDLKERGRVAQVASSRSRGRGGRRHHEGGAADVVQPPGRLRTPLRTRAGPARRRQGRPPRPSAAP